MMNRRSFLGGAVAAPFVARLGVLMPVRSIRGLRWVVAEDADFVQAAYSRDTIVAWYRTFDYALGDQELRRITR